MFKPRDMIGKGDERRLGKRTNGRKYDEITY